MKACPLVLAISLAAAPCYAKSYGARGEKPPHAPEVVVTPLSSIDSTSSGQPIILPQSNAQIVTSMFNIPHGAVLPVHKHPFPRYAYMLSGILSVSNDDTGKTEIFKKGAFIAEAVGQWHHAQTIGTEPVRLLVIDVIEKGQTNTIVKPE